MNLEEFKTQNKYNLFIVADKNAWESDSYVMMPNRCLTSYTDQFIKENYDLNSQSSLAEIMKFPCIFAYEDGIDKNPYIGYLTNIKVRKNGVKINFKKFNTIPLEIFKKSTFELDIDMNRSITELMHTHWTIKSINLYDELKEILSDEKNRLFNKPTVFISYSWKPTETKERVDNLVKKLENDNVTVLYDKKSLFPGQDINVFMEQLSTNPTIKKVLIICTKTYVDKADNRIGGVGTESEIIIPQVYGKPMQNKIIPIFFEKDENNNPYVPTYLKSRYGIDLTPQNEEQGYKDLIEDIFREY